ncbi:hypothetical protein K2173_002018 [Erythroxylum novogranatense]|uniref:PHD-type domain-containing protein n=1 Tax=Erythroxylum novogranatense TaxID=1862640 RepID=A0AAV8SPF1_9ROSI|nr:hypothetical protein K2173_002018 [Erythroxylum novogranatense]
MKRELDSGDADDRFQLASGETATPSSKRLKLDKVNGYFVYSRKCRACELYDIVDAQNDSVEELKFCASNEMVSLHSECGLLENRGKESVVLESQRVHEVKEGSSFVCDLSANNVSHCVMETGTCKDEEIGEPHDEGPIMLMSKNGSSTKGKKRKKLSRFTKSTVKVKGEAVEVMVNGFEAIDGEAVSSVDVEMIAEGSALAPPKRNLELKMSKKIALQNVPMTVKELFETGLLEGVPVVYMGGKKFQAFGLRGMIKDAGILCSCSLCKSRRVIPPSQFEIHAIKQYRRAGQYICFENGKSLLDVLNACRSSSLDSLEATIQSAISGLPEEKTFTCRRCKGTFPSIYVGKVGPLCNSCADSNKSHGSTTIETSATASSAEQVLTLDSCNSISIATSSLDSTPAMICRKPPKSHLRIRSTISPVRMSSRIKIEQKTDSESLKEDLMKKPSRSVSLHMLSRKNKPWKTTPRKSRPLLTSKSLKSPPASVSPQNKCQWKITTKDQRLHKLVFEEGGLPDGTEVAYYARGQKLLLGYKRGFGILCCCCNSEVSPSTFEAHAGWATRKKPYAYIYTSNGVSLHELAISLSKGRKYSAKDNDDLCIICADGGNLVLCDGCPRAFHKGCASLPSIPHGDWYCQFCQNMFEREKFVEHNANALAAGRISGIDPIEQITKRCIRIVRNIEAELSGCVLCRGYDFSRSGFGPRTIILCDQCEKEFHVGCLRTHKIANLKELPKGKWFCSMDCGRIHTALQKLIVRGAEKLPNLLLDVIRMKHEQKGLGMVSDINVRWRLLSGKLSSRENKLLLSQALNIFQECFDPIVDSTGRDLIPLMVFGKNSKGLDYGGMFCAVLTVNSFVVSAGILRIFGQAVAELPLVATSNGNHGKGYFQLLFSCIEKLLSFLNVQSLVLPAAEEAESIWTDKFGFHKIDSEQLNIYRKSCCQMVTFKGTCMLHKTVPACRILTQSTESIVS